MYILYTVVHPSSSFSDQNPTMTSLSSCLTPWSCKSATSALPSNLGSEANQLLFQTESKVLRRNKVRSTGSARSQNRARNQKERLVAELGWPFILLCLPSLGSASSHAC